jgi:hypothetical protein
LGWADCPPDRPWATVSWEVPRLPESLIVETHDIRLSGCRGNSEQVFRETGPFQHAKLDYLAPDVQQGRADMMRRPRVEPRSWHSVPAAIRPGGRRGGGRSGPGGLPIAIGVG